MKRAFCTCLAAFVMLVMLSPAGNARPLYRIEELEFAFPSGGPDMNDLGQIAFSDGGNLYLWLPEPAYSLPAGLNFLQGPLPGDWQPKARAVNNKGQVVGELFLGGTIRPFPGADTFLWLPEPAYGMDAGMHSLALFWTGDVNDTGQVAGGCCGPTGTWQAAVWLPEPAYGLAKGLHYLSADRFSSASGINNRGQAIGSDLNGVFLWLPEPAYGLPGGLHTIAQAEPDSSCQPRKVNDAGEVAGYRAVWDMDAQTCRVSPFLWLPKATHGLPEGFNLLDVSLQGSEGNLGVRASVSINNAGRMAGTLSAYPGIPPIVVPEPIVGSQGYQWVVDKLSFIWEQGTAWNPLEVLDSTGEGWTDVYPEVINNHGQIIGRGTHDGRYCTFLLTPVLTAIDIKPGDPDNCINLRSKGVTPVAILTTEDGDAGDVEVSTVRFAGAAPVRWSMKDVNHDRDMDLVCLFRTQDLSLDASSTTATLTGRLNNRNYIDAVDSVRVLAP